jgi:hypothetical protein
LEDAPSSLPVSGISAKYLPINGSCESRVAPFGLHQMYLSRGGGDGVTVDEESVTGLLVSARAMGLLRSGRLRGGVGGNVPTRGPVVGIGGLVSGRGSGRHFSWVGSFGISWWCEGPWPGLRAYFMYSPRIDFLPACFAASAAATAAW